MIPNINELRLPGEERVPKAGQKVMFTDAFKEKLAAYGPGCFDGVWEVSFVMPWDAWKVAVGIERDGKPHPVLGPGGIVVGSASGKTEGLDVVVFRVIREPLCDPADMCKNCGRPGEVVRTACVCRNCGSVIWGF